MAVARLVTFLVLAVALLAGSAERPARAAPCPHVTAPAAHEPAAEPTAPAATAAVEPSLTAGPETGPVAPIAPCCAPSCCLAHCPFLLAEVAAVAPPAATAPNRPSIARRGGRLPGDGPWRPPPTVLAR